jgi:hypothetical protein
MGLFNSPTNTVFVLLFLIEFRKLSYFKINTIKNQQV